MYHFRLTNAPSATNILNLDLHDILAIICIFLSHTFFLARVQTPLPCIFLVLWWGTHLLSAFIRKDYQKQLFPCWSKKENSRIRTFLRMDVHQRKEYQEKPIQPHIGRQKIPDIQFLCQINRSNVLQPNFGTHQSMLRNRKLKAQMKTTRTNDCARPLQIMISEWHMLQDQINIHKKYERNIEEVNDLTVWSVWIPTSRKSPRPRASFNIYAWNNEG